MHVHRARRAARRCGCDACQALTREVIAIARGAVGGMIGAEAQEGWDSVEPNLNATRSCRGVHEVSEIGHTPRPRGSRSMTISCP